jgi:hypothetical protein
MTLSCDESNMSRAAEGVDMDCTFLLHPGMLFVKANRSDRLVHGKHHIPVHGFVREFTANMAFDSREVMQLRYLRLHGQYHDGEDCAGGVQIRV